MKRAAALLIALCLIWGAAFAETVFAEEEFAAVEEEFAAVEEVFAVESEEEPVEPLPEETVAVEELMPEEAEEELEEVLIEEIPEPLAGPYVSVALPGGGIKVHIYTGGCSNYKVYRKVNDGPFELYEGFDRDSITRREDSPEKHAWWMDTDLVVGYKYTYRVAAPSSASPDDYIAEGSSTFSSYYLMKVEASALSASSIRITWNPHQNADAYRVYRTETKPTNTQPYPGEQVSTVWSTSYTDTGLKPNTTYYYRVLPCKGGTNLLTQSLTASATTERVQITGLRAVPDTVTERVTLQWDAFSGESVYEVYRSDRSDVLDEMEKIGTAEACSFTDSTAVGGTTYYYRVFGQKTDSLSSAVQATATRLQIADLAAAVHPGSTRVTLTWKAFRGAKTYDVYRAETVGGEMTKIATVSSPVYNDYRTKVGTVYEYCVEATGVTRGSAHCVVQAGSMHVSAVPAYTNAARITWTAAYGVTGYQLFRADKEDGEFKWVKNNPTTTVVNYVLTPGADYWYKVRAYTENADGTRTYGAFSEAVKVHNLGAIEELTVQPRDTNCTFLQWKKVEGCSGYQVFRTVAGTGEFVWVKNATTNQVANYSLTPGTVYYYKLRAYTDLPDGSRSYGQYSQAVMVRILNAAVVLSTSNRDGVITVNWKEQPNVTGYQVFHTADGPDGTYKWLANSTSTTWQHTNPALGQENYYRVRSYQEQPDGSRAYGQFSKAVHRVAKKDFTFEITGSTAALVSYSGTGSDIVIPAAYEGRKVTAIGAKAFAFNSSVKNVTIPDTVTEIGDSAFSGCAGLASVQIPASVQKIGNCAFSSCPALTSLQIPGSVRQIGSRAFQECWDLKTISIGSGVQSIGQYAFNCCYKLSAISLPASVTEIGEGAFYQCIELTSFTFPSGVTHISSSLFFDCNQLKQVVLPRGAVEIGTNVFYNCYKLQRITLPDGLQKIGGSAFAASGLTSLTIPDSVTSIGAGLFTGCEHLSSVTLPKGLRAVSERLFTGCTALKSVKLPDTVTSIGDWAFSRSAIASISLPSGLRQIGENAFSSCAALTSITIPAGVTEIKAYTFADCTALARAALPDSVTVIGVRAFAGCTSLTGITLPKNLTAIEGYAFSRSGLTAVTIPGKTVSLGEEAFGSCANLTSVTIPASVTSIDNLAFFDSGRVCIYAPANSYALQWARSHGIKWAVR